MGTLYLVSTPIGNLEDISIRGLRTLFRSDIVACEDTRRTGQLLHMLGKTYEGLIGEKNDVQILISYHDQVEQKIAPELIRALKENKTVTLVSDSGTPLISDPGFLLVREAVRQCIPVVVIPGASALLTALVGSGLPLNMFTFVGFLPEKQSHRLTLFAHIKVSHEKLSSTYVAYVAPHKLLQTLEDMNTSYGDIDIVLARELTKVHEEYFHGTVREATERFQNPKGEYVLLFTL